MIAEMMMIIIVLQKRNRSVPHAECTPMLQNMPSQVDGIMTDALHNPYFCANNRPGDRLRNARANLLYKIIASAADTNY